MKIKMKMINKKFIFSLIILLVINLNLNFSSCAKQEDLVKNLFGDLYNGDIYSGYLQTSDRNKNLHYMLINSQSNPSKDPLVLWLNGGPGCSSLLGFIQEHGPVIVPDYTTNFQTNNFSWNKKANIIYLEAPAGVGFSYNDNQSEKDLKYDDEITANDNRNALLDFFNKFPEFKQNDFYIAGESYAGVYVPKLAESILKNSSQINLKGILVGNGLTDLEVDIENALFDFAYGHGLYSMETQMDYKANCNTTVFSESCKAARKEIKNALQGLNIYDIYRECPKNQKNVKKILSNSTLASENSDLNIVVESYTSSNRQKTFLNTLKKINKEQKKIKLSKFFHEKFADSFSSLEAQNGFYDFMENLNVNNLGLNDDDDSVWPEACIDDPFPTAFFNKDEIKEKLHVRKEITYKECNDLINQNYKFSDSLQIYNNTLLNSGLRIWFYSGDTDAAVPFTGTINWLPKLNMDITESYRRWVINGQTAGYVQSYDSMVYITVLGTGHMAPQWKRENCFAMFNSFLKGERLPAQ
jgi:carboxypeptidase C (cathepsin A)